MLLGLLLSFVVAPGAAEELPEVAPPVAPVPISVGATWQEERGSRALRSNLWSLARSRDGAAWLVGLEDGSVYRSMDGARTWSRVLRPPGSGEAELDEEEVLLLGEDEAREEESRARTTSSAEDEAESEAATSDSVVEDHDAEASAADAGSEGDESPTEDVAFPDLDQVQSAIGTDEDAPAAALSPAVVWFSPTNPELALLGRSDGIWRSADGGRSWSRQDREADALRFLNVPELGIVIAGTRTGVRVSPDAGVRWFDAVDVTDGRAVDALVVLGKQILAGSSSGLFSSTDGLRWKRLPLTGAVTGLLPDPSWEGGLWVTTPTGLLRSDDGAATFYTAGRQVLSGLRGLAALSGTGHVGAWGSDGVWETTDGGVTWRPVFKGLRDPDVRDMVVVGDQPVIVASRAVWRLTVGIPEADPSSPTGLAKIEVPLLEQQLLGHLIDLSTRRTGLDLNVLSPSMLATKRWLPTVMVQATYGTQEGREAQFLQGQTDDSRDGELYVIASACFGRCAGSGLYDVADVADSYASSGTAEVATMAADEIAEGLDEFYTLDGQLLGAGSESFAATNTGQRMRKYRTQVAQQVVGAWSTLQRLDRDTLPPSLAGQVARLLDIQEAESRLDLFTDGAYSRARLTESKP